MLHNSNLGEIYDTIFYCIQFFSRKEIEYTFKYSYSNSSFMFDCLEEIDKNLPPLPDILSPFFYSSHEIATPLSRFFSSCKLEEKYTISAFIDDINLHSSQLYQYTIDSIFGTAESNISPMVAPATYIASLSKMDLQPEFKLQVSLLFGNFSFAVSTLVETLRKVYAAVHTLHTKYESDILFAYKNTLENLNSGLYERDFRFKQNNKFREVSFCLLNQYIVYYHIHADEIFMILGIKHEEALTEYLCSKNFSAENFIVNCGNEIRMGIINELLERGELTASQLAKFMDVPVSTVIRHLDVMRVHNIIYVSNRKGLQIFYNIDIQFFRQTKMNIDKLFDRILNK